jgi:hypothetical protein
MLVSKLVFAVIVLAAVPVLLDAADLLSAGVSPRWLLPEAFVYQLAWLLPVMAVAAVTIGLPRFLLIALFEIVLFIGITGVVSSLGVPVPASPAPVVITGMAVLGAALFTYVYATRRVRSSGALFVVAPAVLCSALAFAPKRDLDWPFGDTRVFTDARQGGRSVSIDRDRMRASASGSRMMIHAPLTISGLPPDRQVLVSAIGWVEADSKRVTFYGGSGNVTGDLRADGSVLLKDVLGGATLLNPGEIVFTGPWVSVSMPRVDFDRVKDRPIRMHLNLALSVYKYRQTDAVVPLKAGVAFDTAGGNHVKVLAVRPGDGRVTLSIRQAAFGWFGGLPSTYLVRSAHLGQAVIGSWHQARSFGEYARPSNIVQILPIPLHASYTWNTLDFDFARPGVKSVDADEWLTDGQLVVASRPAAGRWRATVDLRDIRLAALPRPSGPAR